MAGNGAHFKRTRAASPLCSRVRAAAPFPLMPLPRVTACLLACPALPGAQEAALPEPDPLQDMNVVLQMQIFLDNQLFGPGKLDGVWGEFTHKAAVNYNFARGRADIHDLAPVMSEAARAVPVILAAWRIPGSLLGHVDPSLPEDPEQQSKFPAMAYRSLRELVAERFHTDETFLALCNPGLDLARLEPGVIVTVPNVSAFRIEDIKPLRSFPRDEALSARTIVVDTTERIAAIYDAAERLVAGFPITPGRPEFIPVGTWSVQTMITTPNFRYDRKFLEEGTRGEEAWLLPPGPNSPIGVLWCGLSKSGIGIHGTALPRTIGRSRSAGCVRLANWDAIRLPALVRPGARVIVR
ncbi:MAG TPA: murein L,D-transpeptidase [Verrucomicrobiales bacterium]|nr:murein L,D-transpeptidase [Verrucomicrobiales bacterium]